MYAALQLAYVGFNVQHGMNPTSAAASSSDFLEEFATVTSLPLKLVLIGYWYWVLENGLLASVAIDDPEMARPLGVITKRNRARSPAHKEFVAALREGWMA